MNGRRRITLYDQMTAGNTSSRDSLASLFLDDGVLVNQKTEAEAEAEAEAEGSRELNRSRTLLDIIREDAPSTKDRRSWKAFKEKLWLKRAFGSASENSSNNTALSQFSSRNSVSSQTRHDSVESTQHNTDREQQNDVVVADPESSNPTTQVQFSGRSSIRYGSSDEDDDEHETGRTVEAESSAVTATAANLSLMDLLEETDQEMGIEMELDRMSENDDVEVCEEQEEQEQLQGGVVEYNCCVCMVRHKGAAFIPCGHTFCRMCSRELWVSRGNCPLCNNFILEILDIF